MLQAHAHGDGEAVEDGAERGALPVDVEEDLAEAAVLVFAGAEVDLGAAHADGLGVAAAAVGHAAAVGAHQLVGHGLGDSGGFLRAGGLVIHEGVDAVQQVEVGGHGLAHLGAVAVEGHGLQHELPAGLVDAADLGHGGFRGQVDGLADGAAEEGLGRAHHAQVAHGGDIAPAGAAAAVGAVEDGQVLILEVGRALHGHGAAEAEQEGLHLLGAEVPLQAIHIDGIGGVEGGGELLLHQGDLLVGPAVALEHAAGDAGGLVGDLQPAHHMPLDLLDLLRAVAQPGQGLGDGAVHQLEVAAAGQLLELHQGEVGLDAGGVAVHEQADGARGRQHGHLGVAEPPLLAVGERRVPALAGGLDDAVGHAGAMQALGPDGELLVLRGRGVVGGAAVVADDPQHVVGVALVAGEGAQLTGHLGAGGVGIAREDGRQGRAPLGALDAVVGDAHAHEHGAQVGVAQAQGAEVVAELRDGLAGELGHEHADFEHHGPEADGVAVTRQVEAAVLGEEGAEVQGGQVAGRVIQEHVLGAGVARVDGAVFGAGVPVVDGGVELDAGIGAGPGGAVHLLPEVLGAELLRGLAVDAALQLPVAVHLQGAHEGIGHAHRVVGVHAAHGEVALTVPGGVVALEVADEVALGQATQALGEERGGHALALGAGQGLAQGLIGLGVGILGGGPLHGLADGIPVAAHHGAARRDHGHLALLGDLPVDEGLDVGMVQVEADHLGGAAGGAAALDGAGGAVAHGQEAHEA